MVLTVSFTYINSLSNNSKKSSLSQDNLLVSCTNFVLFGPKKVGTTSQDMLSAYDNIKDISAR